ncbi:hypothetical protein BY457_11716 [Marinilabilia salmonicolor]|jgi:hypothetical protein|uniref:hypothetical protein n=1 Tax=Marinilabilia salmonicolor TaxID=989 RepID=UPI000D071328|nr:hypothetical protein [Marinilabilia salmonicolor]PRY95968.1 hypothetical protein BY457_11716 [Marinilabilia salmonicolor]
MKNPIKKKIYSRPELVEVELDQMIVLQVTSTTPPDQPGFTSESPTTTTSTTDTTEEPLKTNNFEENPFQR